MTDSFRRIDYSIRPAKHAERRMLCDIFRKLAAFEPVENYRYVGFGSVWFADFTLFHRALGIRNMLSIEQAVSSKDRFEANKPFNLHIDFRMSTQALPEMGYERRQFIWLDYDDPLSPEMLHDVAIIATRARSGTVLVVSLQCHRAREIAEADRECARDESAATAEERFRTKFGNRIDPNIGREDLVGWSFGTLSRGIVISEIEASLETRRLANPADQVTFTKICDFEYEDGAKMTTLAVVFCSPDEEERLSMCGFDNLEFVEDPNLPVYIPTPKLTPREFRQLESQLPLAEGTELAIGHIPLGEANSFKRLYRYFPNFVVIES
ncbi:O-methyltransferase [Iodidimonas sp. SYSU 1G8]|uniref:O-methyltransferase n=1 Tax=Iodidimonas sp. SYSU 1G8 TaxID=3133967 RepID=UPI0031FEE8E8